MDKQPLTPAQLMRQLMDQFNQNAGRDAVGSLFQPEVVERQVLSEEDNTNV